MRSLTKRAARSLLLPAMQLTARAMSAAPESAVPGVAELVRNSLAHRIYRAERVAAHLRMAFGDTLDATGIARLTERYYQHASTGLVELLRYRWWTRERVLAATERDGCPELEAALRRGAGVILICGHIGAWEMGWLAMTHCGYPVSAVYRPQRKSELTHYLDGMRRWHGLHLIRESAPLECLAALRGGRILVLCVDVKPREGGVVVPFFGHPAAAVTGPALLAMKSGAPVYTAASYRLGLPAGGRIRYRCSLSGELEVSRTGDRQRDIYDNTARFQLAIEDAIRRCPEQWIWEYRRWDLSRMEGASVPAAAPPAAPAPRAEPSLA